MRPLRHPSCLQNCETLVWAHNSAALTGVLICTFLLVWWLWNQAQNIRPYLCPDCGGDYMKGECTCEL